MLLRKIYNLFLHSIYEVTNMLPVNCNLTITNFDAADTLWRNLVFLLDVFSLRSFISVTRVLPLADPAQVCLWPRAASTYREPRLVTCRVIVIEAEADQDQKLNTWESYCRVHREFPQLILLVISVMSSGDLVEIVQGGEDAALARLGETRQQEVGVNFWFVWSFVTFLKHK